jgi:hypothetical protein
MEQNMLKKENFDPNLGRMQTDVLIQKMPHSHTMGVGVGCIDPLN